MKKIVLYDPSVSSLNMGDHIISDGVKNQLHKLLNKSFIVEISTHLPVSNYLNFIDGVDYKFVCGSNLLRGKMNRRFRQWDINILKANMIGPVILIGVGWWQYGDEPNLYTKLLYKKVLSSGFIHSVRDSYTEKQLKRIGINNVINTSCPTMWNLTKEHCKNIPLKKAENVICTITDYNRDVEKDKIMLNILCENYKNVFLWLQGYNDYEYFKELNLKYNKIKLIPPSLKEYDSILNDDIDYIGTRLHAGIRALQKYKRSIIIAIDNRAIEKQKDFNITCISRHDISKLQEKINSTFITEINIPVENINKWKSQFS
jgi:polysaccharide pyruvyl transferase WcaK-like protein